MKNIYKIALVFMFFNFTIIVMVNKYRTTHFKEIKSQQVILHDELQTLEQEYKIMNNNQRTSYLGNAERFDPTESAGIWGRYSRYYNGNDYNLKCNWKGCLTNITVKNLEVFCSTSNKKFQESIIKDTIIVSGRVVYSYECKLMKKKDNYIFMQYQLPHNLGAYYDDVDDPERIYITAFAQELMVGKIRICKVFFCDISNSKGLKIIDSTLVNLPTENN